MKLHTCPHCGASMKRYWHSMTPMLAIVLAKFYAAILAKGQNYLHISKEINLSKTEYNNFQKLRYHDLINQTKNAGYWSITQKGVDLLKGRTTIPYKVQTFRGSPIKSSTKQVNITDILVSNPYLEERDDYDYDLA